MGSVLNNKEVIMEFIKILTERQSYLNILIINIHLKINCYAQILPG